MLTSADDLKTESNYYRDMNGEGCNSIVHGV